MAVTVKLNELENVLLAFPSSFTHPHPHTQANTHSLSNSQVSTKAKWNKIDAKNITNVPLKLNNYVQIRAYKSDSDWNKRVTHGAIRS